MYNNQRGAALIMVFIIITVLAVFGGIVISRSISENRLTENYKESLQAFWLAEAGVNRALSELRTNYDLTGTNLFLTALGQGQYNFDIATSGPTSQDRTVTSRGCIPSGCACSVSACRVIRTIEAVINKVADVPPNFYDKVIYAAGNISDGDTISGDIIHAGTYSPARTLNGTDTQDSSISPLALLDFAQLRAISQAQGNYHDAAHLSGPFPASFWYNQAAGIPNVVFLEGNFDIAGNITVGGFIVVGGEVSYDATLRGTSIIDGCIYTRGNFTIKGGGNALNVSGVIWSGGSTNLGGNGKVKYNENYAAAIKNLGINTDAQITSWRDTQPLYNLSP